MHSLAKLLLSLSPLLSSWECSSALGQGVVGSLRGALMGADAVGAGIRGRDDHLSPTSARREPPSAFGTALLQRAFPDRVDESAGRQGQEARAESREDDVRAREYGTSVPCLAAKPPLSTVCASYGAL